MELEGDLAVMRGINQNAWGFVSYNGWEDDFKLCKDEISRNPKNVFAHLDMAEVARWHGEYIVAIKACEDAIKLNPDIAAPYELAARIYLDGEEHTTSQEEFYGADEYGDEYAAPLSVSEKRELALEMAGKALKIAPGNIETQMCYIAGRSRKGGHLHAMDWAVRHSCELDIIYERTWEGESQWDHQSHTSEVGGEWRPESLCDIVLEDLRNGTHPGYVSMSLQDSRPNLPRELRHMYAELSSDKTVANRVYAKYPAIVISAIFKGMREGVRLHTQGNHSAARASFEAEVWRYTDDDDEFSFSLDRCYALINLGQYDEALDDCVRALEGENRLDESYMRWGPYDNIRMEYARACYIKGVALAKLGRESEACDSFAHSIESDPMMEVISTDTPRPRTRRR